MEITAYLHVSIWCLNCFLMSRADVFETCTCGLLADMSESPLMHWSCEQVVDYVEEHMKLPAVAAKIKELEIEGATLCHFTIDQIKSLLLVEDELTRIKLQGMIAKLSAVAPSSAKPAAATPVDGGKSKQATSKSKNPDQDILSQLFSQDLPKANLSEISTIFSKARGDFE